MEFAVWVFRHAAEHQLKAMGPAMLQVGGGGAGERVGVAGGGGGGGGMLGRVWVGELSSSRSGLKTLQVILCCLLPGAGEGRGGGKGLKGRADLSNIAISDRRPVCFTALPPPPSTLPSPCYHQGLLESLAEGGAQDTASMTLRGFAYQAVGCLAQRVPQLLGGRTDIAQHFFRGEGGIRGPVPVARLQCGCCVLLFRHRPGCTPTYALSPPPPLAALSEEPAGLRATVAEACSALAGAFRHDLLAPQHHAELEALLIASIASHKVRIQI